jgi:hypothetical protein
MRRELSSRRLFVPTQPVLSSALLTAALLTATLFFLLAPLTLTFLPVAILLSAALLSGRRGFAWFVWILLCVHGAFLIYYWIYVWVIRTSRFDLFNQIGVESDLA